MADEDPHGDLVALILIFVAAVLLAAVVWLLMRKYRTEQMKSFECTPPKLASPIPSPPSDLSLLLATDQLRQQPEQLRRPGSIQEQSASASKFTSTAADTSQADQSKLEAEEMLKPPPKPKDRPHGHQSGSVGLRDSKGAAKRSAKPKETEASRKKSRRSSATIREKSISAPTKRRSKHHRPEPSAPEVLKTAPADRLSVATSSCPHQKGSLTPRAAVVSASTPAASSPATPASATGAGVRRNPTTAAENVTQDHPRKASLCEELSPVSVVASAQQVATSPEAGGDDDL